MKQLSQVNMTEIVALVKAQLVPCVVTVCSQRAADMQGRLVPGAPKATAHVGDSLCPLELLLSGLVRVERWP